VQGMQGVFCSCLTAEEPSTSQASETSRLLTMLPLIQCLNQRQKSQLAHFTAINTKSFSFYGKMAQFCQNTYQVRKS